MAITFWCVLGLARSVTAVISSRVRSYRPHSAVGLSFRRAAVAESHARNRLDLVRGRSLMLRVSPNAEGTGRQQARQERQ